MTNAMTFGVENSLPRWKIKLTAAIQQENLIIIN